MNELTNEAAEGTTTAVAKAPETGKKGHPARTEAPCRALGSEGYQEGHLREESPKTAPKANPRANVAKGGEDKGVRAGSKTETILGLLKRSGGANPQGVDEADRMAGAFRARLSLRRRYQEDGVDGRIHQERKRGTHVLGQSLNHAKLLP
jgi:hypothetical protein